MGAARAESGVRERKQVASDGGAGDILRLLVSCSDQPGIVASLAGFLAAQGANIVSSDQYSTDPEGGRFYMRTTFALPLLETERAAFEAEFALAVADPLGMQWRLWRASDPKRIAVLVSRYDHCLLDLLWRSRRGEIDGTVDLVVSNHPDLEQDAVGFGVPYRHVPVSAETKPESERRILDLIRGQFDLVVLARYMQILSGDFLKELDAPLINIHHSFLPAFPGAGPYARAKERGVKLIGATAHYVTEELDAGPIIEQDVIRVSHRDGVEALTRLGADIERTVLARAVQRHCEDRVLTDKNTTVVF